jgi:hypothetical protein
MADYNVIADVSKTLEVLLTDGLSTLQPPPPPVALVHDLQANIPTQPASLTIFLYEVIEDWSARNKPNERAPQGNKISIKRPGAALLCRYLLTPWSGDRATDQRILGRAMQVLYDNAIVNGPALQGSLFAGDEALRITMIPISLEDRARVWHAINKPYHLSANYEVRVVNVDSERERLVAGVSNRRIGVGQLRGAS